VGDHELSYEALSTAISLYRQPLKARELEKTELPRGISVVLRIAAEGQAQAGSAAEAMGTTVEELYQACLFYLQTIMLHPNAGDARLLGLSEPVDPHALRDHKRLILKWLHPDRNRNNWENKLFLRVHAAIVRLEKKIQEPTPAVIVTRKKKASVPSRYLLHSLDIQGKKTPQSLSSRFMRHSVMAKVMLAVVALAISAVTFIAISTEGRGLQFLYEASN
jgi:hypothetical protein